MRVIINEERGYHWAMRGVAKSRKQRPEDMPSVMDGLAAKDRGHNSFLEFLVVWMEVDAPRYWWQQFDTYDVGVSRLSESTMNNLLDRPLDRGDFAGGVDVRSIGIVNDLIEIRDLPLAKKNLPEGYLQKRSICTNYKALRNIVQQRKTHWLTEWRIFVNALQSGLEHPGFLGPY